MSPVASTAGVYTQRLCRRRAKEGSDVEGGAAEAGEGPPGAWNVNWEDCFNKALISANAWERVTPVHGATQAGRAAHSQTPSANTTGTTRAETYDAARTEIPPLELSVFVTALKEAGRGDGVTVATASRYVGKTALVGSARVCEFVKT